MNILPKTTGTKVMKTKEDKFARACITKVVKTKKGTFVGYLLLDNDSVEFFNRDQDSVGLVYTSNSDIYFNEKHIGRIRLPFGQESQTLKMVLFTDGDNVVTVDSGVNSSRVECYLEAEAVFTKHLIDNDIIDVKKVEEEVNKNNFIRNHHVIYR